MTLTRPKLIGVGVVLVGLGVWMAWQARPMHLVNLPPTAKGPWVAFGDSLTQGVGANPTESYPEILGDQLGVSIRNLGVQGETSSDALRRLPTVAQLRPRVVLLCFGGNDALQRVPQQETFANLERLVAGFQEGGSFVVLIGVRSATLRDRYSSSFSQLARKRGALHVSDILDGLVGRPVYMSDPVHPNAEGYRRIAQRVGEALQPYLAEINPGRP